MAGLVEELRRRNVFRVAAAYAVVAWILIEAGSVLMPTFGAPDWLFRPYVIVVIAGFLISVVFAWIFELTPEGIKLERDVDRSASITNQTGRKLDFAIIALLIVALAISLTLNLTETRAPATDRSSIAVLPFSSLSTEVDNRQFADGIHDDLLTRIANIPALKVISRTSVMEYRDTTKNLRQIGAEPGVGTVLEGAVQRVGERVRINAQLIDAQTDEHIWARTYDRELSVENIFAIQSEISTEIASALEKTLTEVETTRLAEIPTDNLAAYNLYHQGRANLNERTLQSLQQAKEQFEQAIGLDPSYAEAYAGLADAVQLLLINHTALPIDDAFARAEEALDRALELDPNLADAHASLGLLRSTRWGHFRRDEEKVKAEAAFERAIALNPNHARATMWFASLRASENKVDEAIALYNRALQLDPLARIPYLNLPGLYASQGENDKALASWLEAIEIHPSWPSAYNAVSEHLLRLGRLDEGIAWSEKTRELSTDPLQGSNLIGSYIELGDIEKANELMRRLPLAEDHPLYAFGMGIYHYYSGRYAEASDVFEQAIENAGGVQFFMLNLLTDAALLEGDYDAAYGYLQRTHPESVNAGAEKVDRDSARAAIMTGFILQQRGDFDAARPFLSQALAAVRATPRVGRAGHGIRDVQILALQGNTEAALDTLEQAIAEGFRGTLAYDNWVLDEDPYLSSLRGNERFEAMREQMEEAKAAMLVNVREAEATGNWQALRDLTLAEST